MHCLAIIVIGFLTYEPFQLNPPTMKYELTQKTMTEKVIHMLLLCPPSHLHVCWPILGAPLCCDLCGINQA